LTRVLAAALAALLVAAAAATTLAAPAAPADRASLRRAADEASRALARRAAAPGAAAATRRAARGLVLLQEALAERGTPLDRALSRRFTTEPAREVFVTGYHEPTLAARRRPDARFRHPLHRPPPERTGLPSRAAIEAGALAGRGLELLWTDDPVELFFLHVQGSGRVRLADGAVLRVGYAGNNGHAYRSIGAVLVERGVFRPVDATAPAIKAWLRAHPAEQAEILRQNPRYVFFRELPADGSEGPPGALGVPLVPYRSIAVDPKVVPLGSIGRLRVPLPGRPPFDAMVIAMDTGAAIAGPRRIDLFCGADDEAAALAGVLRHEGTIEWLAPRP
jgi:membrane-bound lytic murein transglycosylase A